MKRVKKITAAILIFVAIIIIYTMYANRNSINMTPRQKILKAFYPAFIWANKIMGSNTSTLKNESAQPAVSFYSLQTTLNSGGYFDFSALKGKKVLLVNTASDCGYTNQYDDLEKLYQQYKGQIEILAFPANDFKEQEKGNDADIAAFCKKNYGVTFPLMTKSIVIKSADQNRVFVWLTNPASNGWNSKPPGWNFSKYLVNEKGQLTHYFDPAISPLSEEVINAINEN
jgi:glutathione peroxidase